jgi:hypothetical protein
MFLNNNNKFFNDKNVSSNIWHFFEKPNKNVEYAKCKECSYNVCYINDGTTNLWRHLISHLGEEIVKILKKRVYLTKNEV